MDILIPPRQWVRWRNFEKGDGQRRFRSVKDQGERKVNKGQSGQVLAEFALISFILVLIIAGIVDFARMGLTDQALVNATRDGARTGAVQPVGTPLNLTVIEEAVRQSSRQLLNQSQLEVDASQSSGEEVVVKTTYHFQFIFGGIVGKYSSDRQITCVMQRE